MLANLSALIGLVSRSCSSSSCQIRSNDWPTAWRSPSFRLCANKTRKRSKIVHYSLAMGVWEAQKLMIKVNLRWVEGFSNVVDELVEFTISGGKVGHVELAFVSCGSGLRVVSHIEVVPTLRSLSFLSWWEKASLAIGLTVLHDLFNNYICK